MSPFERYAPKLSGKLPRQHVGAPEYRGGEPTGPEAMERYAPRIKPADWSPFGHIGLRFSPEQLAEFAADDSRLARVPETVNRVLELHGKGPVDEGMGAFSIFTPWIGGPTTGFLNAAAVAVPLLDEAVYVASLNVDPAMVTSADLFLEGATAVTSPNFRTGGRLAIYTIAVAVHGAVGPSVFNNLAIVKKAPWMPAGLMRLRVVGVAAMGGMQGEIQIGAYGLVQARAPIPIEYRLSRTSPGDVLVPTRTS